MQLPAQGGRSVRIFSARILPTPPGATILRGVEARGGRPTTHVPEWADQHPWPSPSRSNRKPLDTIPAGTRFALCATRVPAILFSLKYKFLPAQTLRSARGKSRVGGLGPPGPAARRVDACRQIPPVFVPRAAPTGNTGNENTGSAETSTTLKTVHSSPRLQFEVAFARLAKLCSTMASMPYSDQKNKKPPPKATAGKRILLCPP